MITKTVFVDSDKASIEIRLSYNPLKHDSANQTSAPAIVIAHPYGPFGGNMHNNVVIALQKSLVNRGYTTASFNFRGSGNSTGKTSWTGVPEQKDYQAVIDFVLDGGEQHEYPAISHLLVCGYSYGSMIAASIRETRVSTSYILISYPLRVAWALSTTKMSYFRSQVNELLTAEEGPAVLLVFGDQDQFTGINAYRSWIKTITSDNAKSTIVEGVDHFWMDKETLLLDHIFSWISTVPSLP